MVMGAVPDGSDGESVILYEICILNTRILHVSLHLKSLAVNPALFGENKISLMDKLLHCKLQYSNR